MKTTQNIRILSAVISFSMICSLVTIHASAMQVNTRNSLVSIASSLLNNAPIDVSLAAVTEDLDAISTFYDTSDLEISGTTGSGEIEYFLQVHEDISAYLYVTKVSDCSFTIHVQEGTLENTLTKTADGSILLNENETVTSSEAMQVALPAGVRTETTLSVPLGTYAYQYKSASDVKRPSYVYRTSGMVYLGNKLKNIGLAAMVGYIRGVYSAAILAYDVVVSLANEITDLGDPEATRISWVDYAAPRTNDTVVYHYRHDVYTTTETDQADGSIKTDTIPTIGSYYRIVSSS